MPVTTLFSLKDICKSCHAFCLIAFSLDKRVSPLALSTFSINTSASSPTSISDFWPGLENSLNGIRPSLFKPTSIVTISFSIETTFPRAILFSFADEFFNEVEINSSYSELDILLLLCWLML